MKSFDILGSLITTLFLVGLGLLFGRYVPLYVSLTIVVITSLLLIVLLKLDKSESSYVR